MRVGEVGGVEWRVVGWGWGWENGESGVVGGVGVAEAINSVRPSPSVCVFVSPPLRHLSMVMRATCLSF